MRNRDIQRISHTSQGKSNTGVGLPSDREGSNGDIWVREVNGKITLCAKYNNTWRKFTQDTVSSPLSNTDVLGAWESKAEGTVYLAETDGFVVVSPADTGYYQVFTDTSNPPTTERIEGKGFASYGSKGPTTCPVRKGHYWKVLNTYSADPDSIWWIPFAT